MSGAPVARLRSWPGRRPPRTPRGPYDRAALWFRLRDGSTVLVRPIRPEDRAALVEGFSHLSEASRYQRFLAPMARLSARQLSYLTEIDQVGHVAWVAGRREHDGSDHGLGVARFVRAPGDPGTAEFAVVVADDVHGRGIGTLLLEVIATIADHHGVRTLEGLCFAENRIIQHMLDKLGASFASDGPAVLRAAVALPAPVSLGWMARRAVRWAAGSGSAARVR